MDTSRALCMPEQGSGQGGCTGGSLYPPRTQGVKLDDHDPAQTQPKGTELSPPHLLQGVKLCRAVWLSLGRTESIPAGATTR